MGYNINCKEENRVKIQTKNDNIRKEENVKVYRNLHTCPEPEHTHEFIEIAYIYSGFGYHKINDKKYFVQRGDLLIMGFDDVHSFEPDGGMGVPNRLSALLNLPICSRSLISENFRGREICRPSSIFLTDDIMT